MSSHLPKDMMTPTMGLNGLMEQFPDEDYGAGVLTPDLLPSGDDRAGEVSLPDGIVLGIAPSGEGELGIEFEHATMSLADLDHTVMAATVADLSWLEVDEQDLSRLPKNPVDLSVPELEEAFAANRGTPGIHFRANVDPELARYRASLAEEPAPSGVPYEALQVLARKAMRLSAANPDVPFTGIVAQVKAVLATMPEVVDHLDKLQPVLARIAEEHGLAGRVFIRAEAYPNYEQGEWADEIRRHRSARYIVVPKRGHGQAHHVRGVCTITGKRVVAAVPWERARKEYTPQLKATGRPIAAEGDPKAVLKAAFVQQPQGFREVDSSRPRHVAPSQRMAFEDAHAALQAHSPERKALSRKAQDKERQQKIAQLQIAKWVKAGSLTKKQGIVLVNSKLSPAEMLKAAAVAIARADAASDFSGTAFNVNELAEVSHEELGAALVSNHEARELLQAGVAQDVASRREALSRPAKDRHGMEARVGQVVKAIDRGIRGEMLAKLIRTTIRKAEWDEAVKLLAPILRKTGALREGGPRVTAEFSGPVVQEHVPMRKAHLTPTPRELATYIKWARVTFAEGILGADFDAINKTRWPGHIRAAGARALQILRNRHEGLSGHLYVDAGAYISKVGTRGCDDGALQHRTGPAQFVLACERCQKCTSANQRASGRDVCQKYNKDIITAEQLPADEARAYQQRTIAAANMTDAETTASLFAPAYDPNEFELTTPMQIDEATIACASVEPLQDIWFGDDVPLELDPMDPLNRSSDITFN